MKKLARGAIGTGAGTLAYTVPTDYITQVTDIDIANTTAGALTCALHIVDSGGSPATSNMLFPTMSIPANNLVTWKGSQVMNAGDFIQAIGSGAGLTMHITGDQQRIRNG